MSFRELAHHGADAYSLSLKCIASRPFAGKLQLTFVLSGTGLPDVLGLGAGSSCGQRADSLWGKTCIEAFVRHAGANDRGPYFEINVEPPQPFSRWQVYRFDSYRSPSVPVVAERASLTRVFAQWLGDTVCSRTWSLRVELTLPQEAADWESWEVFPAAVIQGVDQSAGTRCEAFWAVTHAEGGPDFHKMSAPDAMMLDYWIQVTLLFVSGREEVITLECSDTIRRAQQLAAELVGRPTFQVDLSLDGRTLDLDESVAMLKQASVTVVIRAVRLANDISDEQIAAAFRALDMDANGVIHIMEFKRCLVAFGFHLSNESLKQVYSDSDDDGDGLLSYLEFSNMMRNDNLDTYSEYTWEQIREAILDDIESAQPKLTASAADT